MTHDNHKTKLQLSDSMEDVLFKMSEGNPGGLTVCINIIKNTDQIDPANIMGGLGVLLSLDSLGLYGSKIWMLFKDVCGSNLPKMIAVIRGWQLGLLSSTQIHHAVENYGEGINVDEICTKVKIFG